MNFSLSVDTKTNLSLWTTKLDHCVESVRVWSFFWCQFFPHLDWIWRLMETSSLRMWRNMDQTNPEWERFSHAVELNCIYIIYTIQFKWYEVSMFLLLFLFNFALPSMSCFLSCPYQPPSQCWRLSHAIIWHHLIMVPRRKGM